VTAFLVAIQKAEHWLAKNVPNETAMIIAEDAGKIKKVTL
jgi:ABC-type nitrate/sulfonate/bicarbonate transport system substrate-binding protein